MPIGFMLVQLLFLAVPVGALGFFGWLALRYVRARERDVGGRLEARPDELARLNEELQALQSEVSGIRERQDFVEKLLERPRSCPEA
jgi:hypothetical protein